MKKFAITLLTLLFLWAALYAFFQGPTVRNFIRSQVTKNLREAGIRAEIGSVEGTLPDQIELKNVKASIEGTDVAIEQLILKPILWRLLKNEIAFQNVFAKNLSIGGAEPFDFKGKFWMNRRNAVMKGEAKGWEGTVELHRMVKKLVFHASHPDAAVSGHADLDSNWHPETANVHASFHEMDAHLLLSPGGKMIIDWSTRELRGVGQATLAGRHLTGELHAGQYATATIDWTLLDGGKIEGNNVIEVQNLQSLSIPNVYGQLKAKLEWTVEDGVQKLQADATATNLYYYDLFAKSASVYSDLTFPLDGLVDITIENGKWRELKIDNAMLTTQIEGPFDLFLEGEWKHPLELTASGSWKDDLLVHIDHVTGSFFNHPVVLLKPVDLVWTDRDFKLQNVEIAFGSGEIITSIDNTSASLKLVQIPLDVLSLNPLDVAVDGEINLEGTITENKGKMQATITQTEPFDAQGVFSGDFSQNRLHLAGNLNVDYQPLATVDVTLPIDIWNTKILWDEQAKGSMRFNGELADILDFFDLGSHRFEGFAQGELSFSNTLARPLVEGKATLVDGAYENYYTGTVLHNIRAELFAEKNQVYLRSFTAYGEEADTFLAARGHMKLLQKEAYPFALDVEFIDLPFARVDLVTASGDGRLHIEGNAQSALASGRVDLIECALSIPDHIPNTPPKLEVVYRNQIQPVQPPKQDKTPYPLYLDLMVTVPTMTIEGRGLSSEWEGDFHVGGTADSIATKGDLDLIDGEFNFSSRSFALSKGFLLFSGEEHEMPTLHLEANTDVGGVMITAEFSGPLDSPTLTFHSNPPLPLSSIMSRLLFGQDVSEISGFQALELANSLAELGGAGPGLMESTRKALGVDRLRIIADEDEGGERVALQVGKYVAKNVLVTLTQGVDDSEPNISIEVSLKGNLVLVLESDQHQEQGKFALKWHTSY